MEIDLGRVVIGLEFTKENAEKVKIFNIDDIKEFFNKKYIPVLMKYLNSDDGLLAQFFYGNGNDEIKDFIEQSQKSGKSVEEILNGIAIKLGLEPFVEEGISNQCIYNSKSLYEAIRSSKTYYMLIDNIDLDTDNIDVDIYKMIDCNKNKIILRKNLTLNLNKGLEIQNALFSSFGSEDHIIFTIKSNVKNQSQQPKISFKDTNFQNIILICENINLYIENCVLKNTQISTNNSSIMISGSDVSNFNPTTDLSDSSALLFLNSKCEMDSVKVFGNYSNGINCKSSTLSITNSDIFKNGNNKDSYSQLWLEKSQVNIQNTQVHDGVNNEGIYIGDNSTKCKMEHVKTYGHKRAGLRSSYLVKYNNCSFEDGIW
ncbi:hypothetical protein [Desulfurella sp.]|uniref:hypothetical protein n=1 Tax=Desulfurella sp. TaxID=1962857 RepID=UPI0025BF591C|nr:hypothetical protein [Desulfurella sp.]